jgi:hypothetical protein
MYDPRMFKLFLRLLGVVACLMGTYALIPLIIYVVVDWQRRMSTAAGSSPFEWAWAINPAIHGGILFALGTWLLRGSPSLANWIIREVETHCAYCSFPLEGLTSSTCPECGRLQPGRAASATHGPTKAVRTDVKNADQKAT